MNVLRATGVLIVGLAILAGCGGRADVPVATIPGGDGESEFSLRQTQIAQQGAATLAARPTATRTATPAPSPTATPLPTRVPVTSTPEGASTAESTPGFVAGIPATETPVPTPEPGVELALITGCTDEELTVQITSDELESNLEDWVAMGAASQAIFNAWDEFFVLIEDFILYNQVIDNTEVFEGAAEFEAVAEEHLPALEAIEESSPFYNLAQTVIATTQDQIAVGELLTRAGTEQDPTAWDEALEISSTFTRQAQEFSTEFDLACDYWEAQP